MKKFLIVFSLLTIFKICLAEPLNLDIYKHQLLTYHDSGHYLSEIKSVINAAQQTLAQAISQRQSHTTAKPLAVVLDIDETALSNFYHLKTHAFTESFADFKQNALAANDPVISPTLALYRYAKKNHVLVFFITGRSESLRQATAINLAKAGYHNWDGLYLRPPTMEKTSATIYKQHIRAAIEKQGYQIVVNIGDQWSDLRGGYATATFKLPNPYYFIA